MRLPWRDAVAAAERGEISDAKSIVGILWLARRMEAAGRAESGKPATQLGSAGPAGCSPARRRRPPR